MSDKLTATPAVLRINDLHSLLGKDMCVCVYVCVCVCVYVCMYVCMYVYVCMHVCMYVYCRYGSAYAQGLQAQEDEGTQGVLQAVVTLTLLMIFNHYSHARLEISVGITDISVNISDF